MKKLLTTIACLVIGAVLTPSSWGALPAGLSWEVRTGGASDNGSCYDLVNDGGTDYTQQDSAQLTLTDLATTGAVTTLTSATGGFTSAMIDNCIYIASGTNFDVGYYEITAFTDTNTVTLDRTPSSAGAGSGGNGKVGGGVDHPDRVDSSLVAGNHVWIQAGTYNRLGSNTYVLDVSDSQGNDHSTPIIWEGYNSVRGDEPIGSNRPVIDCADTATNGITSDGGYNIMLKWLIIQDCLDDGIQADTLFGWGLRVTSNDGDGVDGENFSCAFCEIDTNTGNGVITNAANRNITLYYSYVHDNGGSGAGVNYAGGGGGVIFVKSVADSNSGNGFYNRSNLGFTAVNNVAYNNSSEGFWQTHAGELAEWVWIDNIAHSNGAYGFSLDNTSREAPFLIGHNISYNNTSGAFENVGSWLQIGNLTSNPSFVNAASGNFTVNSGSPALDAGFDFTEINLTGAYKWNIGLDQDDNAAGGAGGVSMYTFTR